MKQGDIVIYNNKECVINGILYMYDKEPQYTLRDLESGLMINGFVSMDEMEKVEKFAQGGYAIPYSYKPKYADGKTKKDIEDLGLNSFGEFDSDDIPASSMQIDANVSYDEARERVEEELKERFSGVLEVDDFWIGDSDVEDEKRVRVRTDIPSEEPELKEIERSGRWDDSYSRLCDELATYEKGGSLWIETDKEPPVNESAFVNEAKKRKMSVEALMNKALKSRTRDDFGSDGDYENYANSKKGKAEIKLRKQAQMVKNMGVYAKGGDVTYTDTKKPISTTSFKIWENYKNINNQQSVGSFSHNYNKRNVGDYYLFLLDDYDRNFYSHIPLKPNEMLFRVETERGRISKSLPLIKINLQNGRVYFMSEDNDLNSDYDDKNPKFNIASADVNYLSLDVRIREYIQGLITYDELYESVDKTYAKGGEVYNAHILTNDNKLIHRRYPKKITHNEIYKEYKDKGVEIKDSQIHFAKPIDFFDTLREQTKKYVRENMNDDVDSENIFISSMQKGNEYIATEIKGDTILGKSFTITPEDLFEVGFKGNTYAEGGEIETKREFVEVVNQVKEENEALPNDFVNVMDSINAILQDRGYEEDDEYTYDIRQEILDRYEEKVLDKQGLRFANGGSVAGVKKMVYSQSGEYNLEEYQDLSNEDMMGESPMGLEEVKAKVFEYNDEAYDYEDEINKIEDVDDLAEFLYDSGLAQRDNTYNQSWWGGVRLYAILNNNGDNFDLDYPTILFMSRHRGGDVRGNYEKYEAFDIEQYGYEQIPFLSATRLTYEVKDGDKKAVFDTEDMEGYELFVVESDFEDFDEGDSTNIDEVEDKLGVELY